MKILLLGKNGQVGWELQRALAPLGDVIALDRQGTDGLCGDLTNLEGLAATVRALAPHIVVNAAAYTAVDKAETEQELAMLINGDAPGVLAREAATLGAWLIHYSTDYVFNGSGEKPWYENGHTGPLSVYGRSKLMGEQAIQASGAKALVLRTSWVYAAKGNNFAKTMLRLATERDSLNVVADQYGAPTGAELIADVTAQILHRVLRDQDSAALAGIYHLAAAGETSWHGFARFILEHAERSGVQLKVLPDKIGAIPTKAYPLPAPRPNNSRLALNKLETTFQLKMPPWQQGAQRMLDENQR
ncbi:MULTISPECIES: dTDP-4-dehydrorhamnose reductase [Pseudomonas syringae group genomosp. 2]|uniref:dTDP-4-dehydrorhamnose reductase n=1 Tax=Pseudomonas syringae group genomosp. 2 TaxID=251698 RepID=UPI0001CC1163|nr:MULTISPECIES: dTDP-4-dehydrorhamnose reductase [Pseudomonas syringae group genomosp. 2]EGH03574.1 dTDP-4-dehydrorhamnose reductase [Pseudomonas amygdali pv. aesculi str. 0893_23]KPW06810.1 dTDP-4-dehydrorhamnose reductase [Pseudomonas amygdali pv. aesculi]KWT16061.1 dTDP-4-dehydrorhamnose reductase [Pseudomonas amygdali pv. aesculi]KWT16560.1 dTDP-4-dehydrorhamnose reductase [Pseudomonas amygdali pv. aesculi]KWT17598.1 dTDP-4-dehydrorhamnose reductase [Pseudomonas amygdali pv. aesculi]